MDVQSEIDAFFSGATTWDFVIMGVVILVMWKIFKKFLMIGIFVAAAYYFFEVYGK